MEEGEFAKREDERWVKRIKRGERLECRKKRGKNEGRTKSSAPEPGLIGVGNEQAARRRESHSPLVDAAATPQVFRIACAALARQRLVDGAVSRHATSCGQVGHVVGTLGAAAASSATCFAAGRVVAHTTRRCRRESAVIHETIGTLGRIVGAVATGAAAWARATTRGHQRARRRPVWRTTTAARGTTAAAATSPAVVGAHARGAATEIVLVAVFWLNLSGTQAQRHTANADVVAVCAEAQSVGFAAVVTDLGGHLATGRAKARAGACTASAAAVATTAAAARTVDLAVSAHACGLLLSGDTGVLKLCALTPDGRLLTAEESNVGSLRGVGGGAAGTGGGGPADVGSRAGAVGRGRRHATVAAAARHGAKGVDGGGALGVAHLRLAELHVRWQVLWWCTGIGKDVGGGGACAGVVVHL